MNHLNTRQKELIESLTEIADKLCDSYGDCNVCPFNGYASCPFVQAHAVQNDISDMEEEPTYEDLPIDLDDCVCDSCDKPRKWGCYNMDECKEDYPFGECCADNLEDNVGRICFENSLPSKLAKDLIGLIKKERERNESLYVHRKYFQDK